MPFLHFYKLLALRPCEQAHKYRLRLNVPDTIIFNDKDSALMWIFTDERGYVTRIDNLPYSTITSKLTEGAVEKELVAVLKKVTTHWCSLNMDMEVSVEMMSRLWALLKWRLFCRQCWAQEARWVSCRGSWRARAWSRRSWELAGGRMERTRAGYLAPITSIPPTRKLIRYASLSWIQRCLKDLVRFGAEVKNI